MREGSHFTQSQCAEILGVSRSTISRAEAHGPSPLALTRLENAILTGKIKWDLTKMRHSDTKGIEG